MCSKEVPSSEDILFDEVATVDLRHTGACR